MQECIQNIKNQTVLTLTSMLLWEIWARLFKTNDVVS